MKKRIVSILGIVLVIGLVFVSFKYFRGTGSSGSSTDTKETITPDSSLNIPAQQGDITERNEQLAAALKTVTGMDYNPINITTVGNPIRTGDFSYQVNKWTISKEDPGYLIPKEQRNSLGEGDGATLDEKGNITNDYSYVVVDMEVENMTSEDISYLIWGISKLRSIGNGTGKYTGEVEYLGDGRLFGNDYYLDTIGANSKKEMPLIFVVKDEYLQDNQLYVEVNPSGVATTNPDFDVKRYIFLE